MAVAAARDCLKGVDRASVGGLYFASTTAPYKEKQTAATIAAVLDLPAGRGHHGLLRARSAAAPTPSRRRWTRWRAARAESILVVRRRHPPRLPLRARRDELRRRRRGPAGRPRTGTIAEVKHFDSRYYEIQDTWRSDRDTFVRTAEDRFSMDEGYADVMVDSVSAALEKYGLAAADVAALRAQLPERAASWAPSPRSCASTRQTQVADVLHAVGGRHRLRHEPA